MENERLPDLLPDLDDDDDKSDNVTSTGIIYNAFVESRIGGENPKTLKEAKRSPEWPEWEKAIQTELNTLKQMGTWEMVDAPKDRKPVTSKWVFVKKYDKDRNLQKYKTRLVARGYTQVPGMDYNETFVPVVRLETI